MPKSILVVEDEQDIAELISFHLTRAGFDVRPCRRGSDALDALQKSPASLVILDLMLPDMDGVEICKRLKAREGTRRLPVLILSARRSEADRILGLELGADDYLPKPFSPRELVLRVQAVLRRTESTDRGGKSVVVGPLVFDSENYSACLHGRQLELTVTEFKLLDYLTQRLGRVVRREDLLENVWGYRYEGGSRTVDTHIQRLRQKLGSLGDWIETVRGVGYRLREVPTEPE
ncbi:MAG TPA: response regulator transcription factor [Acidobacteriota bacterium]|jgi:two-component system phosphate regulon response regulator PhoB